MLCASLPNGEAAAPVNQGEKSDVYDEFKFVTVRVGDAPAREERWSVSTSGDATFAPGWAGTRTACSPA